MNTCDRSNLKHFETGKVELTCASLVHLGAPKRPRNLLRNLPPSSLELGQKLGAQGLHSLDQVAMLFEACLNSVEITGDGIAKQIILVGGFNPSEKYESLVNWDDYSQQYMEK